MEVGPGSHAEEIRHLRRCINDLVSVLALPATWTGGAPSQIVGNSIDALVSMLSLDRLRAAKRFNRHSIYRNGASWFKLGAEASTGRDRRETPTMAGK